MMPKASQTQLSDGQHTEASVCVPLGKDYFLKKNYAAARNELAKALSMEGVSTTDKAEAQLYIGLSYYAENDYARAKPELQKVLAMPGASAQQTHEAMLRLRLRKLIPDGAKVFTALFIGASHTKGFDIPQVVEALSTSAPSGSPRIITGAFTRSSTSIKKFWEEGDGPGTVRAVIAAEPWDFVVFETHPFMMGHDEFVKYATEFASLIRSKNAIPILLENPWIFKSTPSLTAGPYPDVFQDNHKENVALGKKLHIPVAPAGYAWMKYLGPTPTPEQRMALYDASLVHYSKKGAYMLACSVYSTITGLSPVGLARAFPNMAKITPEEAQTFQEAAWQAFQETDAELKTAP